MELYHKITKEVLELLLNNGPQMPVDLARKLQRSSSNMQQVREYLSSIGCMFVTKNRNFYELKITQKGIRLLEALRQVEKLDVLSESVPLSEPPAKTEELIPITKAKAKPVEHEIKAPIEPQGDKRLKTSEEEFERGGRKGILTRLG